MKQVIQPYGGKPLTVVDVAAPVCLPGTLLVASEASLISSGTERSSVKLAQKSLAGKALARPDLVYKVVDTARRVGLSETLGVVRGRLAADAALGYSAAGVVVAVGKDVDGFAIGDRVACAGQNYASHAEVIRVPAALCVPVPREVDAAAASFVAVGAIALQGVRQANPALGETVAVIGLGLVGQLAVRLLAANGCRVLATDLSEERCAIARQVAGVSACCRSFIDACSSATNANGVDAVLVTAATESSGPVSMAADILRKRGVLVVVGDVGLNLQRDVLYLKEIDVRLSTSYGPGRYDSSYEEGGVDYPYAYVRWTEGRNMTAFLELLAGGRVDVADLISQRYPISAAEQAYARLREGAPDDIAFVFEYPRGAESQRQLPLQRTVVHTEGSRSKAALKIAIVGAGNHVQDRLLPRLAAHQRVQINWICGTDGVRVANVARRFNASRSGTDLTAMLADPAIDAVVIGTRHDSHAEIACAVLEAGKHVYLEKPLCLSFAELQRVQIVAEKALQTSGATLFVGFNRRYSSHTRQLREFFDSGPVEMLYRVNAGTLSAEHWLLDPAVGGGRLVGECCHFIDFMSAACGAPVVNVTGARGSGNGVQLLLQFADDSTGSLLYTSQGGARMAKEYVELHGQGRSARLDDFVRTQFWSQGRPIVKRTRPRDIGFDGAIDAFVCQALEGATEVAGAQLADVIAVTRATLLAREQLGMSEFLEVGDVTCPA